MAEDKRFDELHEDYWGKPATDWRERQSGLRERFLKVEATWQPWREALEHKEDGYEAYKKRVREMWDVFRVARWFLLAAPAGLLYVIAELVSRFKGGS